MKSNYIKYIFIVFVIGIMIFAIYKIKKDEEEKNNVQVQITQEAKNKVREINLGIAEYDTMNPIISNNKNVQDIQKLIYEPLINLTSEYKLEAALASEWAKQTDNTYIIKLKNNLKWSNGEKITSEDVRFTIDCLKNNNSIYSYQVENIVELTAVDENTIKITLDKEVPFFEYNLTFPIVSSKGYSNETIPIGSGKYKVISDSNENIILEKNENRTEKENTNLSLEKITINKYANLGEMYNAFKIGNIDLISTNNTSLQEYIGKIGYNEKQFTGREHDFLALNMGNVILSQESVRKAIAHSIDKQNIIASIYNNEYYTSNFPLEYGTWLYKNQNANLEYNLEQAKQVLVDDGWTYKNKNWQKRINNRTQKIVLNLLVKADDAPRVAVAENIKNQLANQGIIINIVQASNNQYINNLNTKNYDIALCSMYLSLSPNLETFFGENNLANYTNDEVNEIMKEIKNTSDENTLKKQYEKLGQIYINSVPYISLYSNKNTVAYNQSLSGEVTPNWFSSFYNIETWSK